MMDQAYSPFADWLSKFHTSSEPIQALWIVALSATVLGVTWIVMRGVREIVGRRARRPGESGHQLFDLEQDGRWLVYQGRHGTHMVDRTSVPRNFIGHDVREVTGQRDAMLPRAD
jgi:hypothetical protein